jgi:segregation and condensation protein B
MEIQNLITHVEVLIFASDKPLTSSEITELINSAFGVMDDKITQEQIDACIEGVIEKYNAAFYPFEIRESGGGWQFLTKRDYHQTVAQLNGDKFLKRLSNAAMETLAIIAYKQPITKGEIEQIRGVNSDYSVTKLLEKELIIIQGRNENMPGRPIVYATSKTFMDYFGINNANELPKISEVLADQLVEPTLINHTETEETEGIKEVENVETLEASNENTKADVEENKAHLSSLETEETTENKEELITKIDDENQELVENEEQDVLKDAIDKPMDKQDEEEQA